MTVPSGRKEAQRLAAEVLAHGKAAFEAGWQGDVSTGYFEDEEAQKKAYELATSVDGLLAVVERYENALRQIHKWSCDGTSRAETFKRAARREARAALAGTEESQ